MEHLGLRTALIDYLESVSYLRLEQVKQAMLSVPRHKFIDQDPLEVYSDQALVIKRQRGKVISTISQPSIVAHMLEELQVEPGDRILEIGTGLGYNAALLGRLTGPQGLVVSVEYDTELAQQAAENLVDYPNVHAVHGDGRTGHRALAPYNKIIATVTSEDIYLEWQEQLSPEGGRLLIPLEIVPGVTRLVTLNKHGSEFSGRLGLPVNFVDMTGEAEPTGKHIPDGLVKFVRRQALSIHKRESLLLYCLLFDGPPEEAIQQWHSEDCPDLSGRVIESGSGPLMINLPSLNLTVPQAQTTGAYI